MTRIQTHFLFLLALVALLFAFGCDKSSDATPATQETTAKAQDVPASPAPPAATGQEQPEPAIKADTVLAYYFHGHRRCRTCVGIQNGIQQAIQERFQADVAAGRLTFREVNIDEDANKHYVQKFELAFSGLVLEARQGETTVKWENCDGVWKHARNPEALMDYTEEKIRAYLSLL